MRGTTITSVAAALLLNTASATPVPEQNIGGRIIKNLLPLLAPGVDFVKPLVPTTMPTFDQPITKDNIVITKENTLNASAPAPKNPEGPSKKIKARGNQRLPVGFYNNLDTTNGQVYITGLDPQQRLVFVKADGSFYYPDYNHNNPGVPQEVSQEVAMPLGDNAAITPGHLPDYLSSGRIYFSKGPLRFATVRGGNGYASLVQPSVTNPSDVNINTSFGFVEFTNNADNLYWNLSFVDFIDLPVNASITGSQGLQAVKGVGAINPGDKPADLFCFNMNQQQQKDGYPWTKLCGHGRALNPSNLDPSNFAGYFDSYVNKVYDFYTNNDLTVNTQAGPGNVRCRVSGGVMRCDGADRTFPKPSTADIFGCNSGPFANPAGNNDVTKAVVPRLCAGFNRGTFLLYGGQVEPSPYFGADKYYTIDTTNHYARVIHALELDHLGYAFSYDDVVPAGVKTDGRLVDGSPTGLLMTIGGTQPNNLARREGK